MVKVCGTCGDKGYVKYLWSCSKCQISMSHTYCLAKMPKVDDKEFSFVCTQCVLTTTTQAPKSVVKYTLRQRVPCKMKFKKPRSDMPVLRKSRLGDVSSTLPNLKANAHTYDNSLISETPLFKPLLAENVLANEEYLLEQDVESVIKDVIPHTILNVKRRQHEDGQLIVVVQEEAKNVLSNATVFENSIKRHVPEEVELTTNDQPTYSKIALSGSLKNNEVSNSIINDVDKATYRGEEYNDGKQERRRKRRKFIVYDDWDEVGDKIEVHNSSVHDSVVQRVQVIAPTEAPNYPLLDPSIQYSYDHYAQPIFNPAWRGCFQLEGERYYSLMAHISSMACPKVFETAGLLPEVLCIKQTHRLEVWPKGFIDKAPTDENIGLYFFPGSERMVKAYDELINHIIMCDLAMQVSLENVELLIFASNQLPQSHWRFNGKYFIWGIFKARKNSLKYDDFLMMQTLRVSKGGGLPSSIGLEGAL